MNAYLVTRHVYNYTDNDETTVFVSLSKEKAREERMRLFILNYVREIGNCRDYSTISRFRNGTTVWGDDVRKSIEYDPESDVLELTTYFEDWVELYVEPLVLDKRYATI